MAGKTADARRAEMLTRRSPVAVGDVVAGKYRVEELLAAGGMGVVAAAQHMTLRQKVAIKFLRPTDEDENAGVRFVREAQAAAQIQSEHVARVFDCGTTDDGIAYMVMEFLSGGDLAQELRARGPLPVAEAIDILLQALEGIAEAHALGIVHRDLKPANLFLATRPGGARTVKVVDFGISKLDAGPDAKDDGLTATSVMLGSPRYMSPEQAQSSKTVDARSDIWSLGVVLYEMLDGKSPFAGNTMGETLSRVLLHEPDPIQHKRPEVPEALASVLGRCLQRDRERRFRNVAELALALGPFGSGRAQSSVDRITALLVGGQLASSKLAAAPVPAEPAATTLKQVPEVLVESAIAVTGQTSATVETSPPEQTAGNWARPSASSRPRRGRIALIVLGACAALGGALALGLALGSAPKTAAPVPTAASSTLAGARERPPTTPPAVTVATTATAATTATTATVATTVTAAPATSASAASAAKAPVTTGSPVGAPPGGKTPPTKRRPQVDVLGASD